MCGVLALLVTITTTLAYQVTSTYDLNTRGVTLVGVHDVESSNGRVFRWTTERASVKVNGIGIAPAHVALVLSGARPNDMPLPSVQVYANGVLLGTLTATRAAQDYAYAIPADALQPFGDLSVTLVSDAFVPSNDLRTLGVALYELRVEPSGAFTIPALLVFLSSVLSVLLLFLSARSLTISPRGLMLAALLLLSLICVGIARERVLTALLLPWLTLATATTYAGAQLKQRMSWRETLSTLAVGLSAFHFVADFFDIVRTSHFTDVTTMFEAAHKLAQGLDPYDYAIVRDNALYAHSYVYPPAFAQFLAIFLPLGLRGATLVWVLLNVALYVVVIVALLRIFQIRARSFELYALLIVAFNFRPVLDTLSGGQLDIVILALLVATLTFAQRGRWLASGSALAFAAITKLHPLIALPFFLTRARWRGLAGFALAFSLIVMVSMLFAGPDLYWRYATTVLPARGGEGTGSAENQSISGFLYRLNGLTWDDRATSTQADSIRLWTYILAGALILPTLFVVWWTASARDSKLDAVHLSLFVVLMLLVLPTSWMHYETQLLLPLTTLLVFAARARYKALLVVWISAAILSALVNQEIFRDLDFNSLPLVLLQSYKLYAVLLLWCALAWAAIQLRATALQPETSITYAQNLGDGAHVQRTRKHRSARAADSATAD